jgi:hypothetical protein
VIGARNGTCPSPAETAKFRPRSKPRSLV